MAECNAHTRVSNEAEETNIPQTVEDPETQSALADIYELVCSRAGVDREAVREHLLEHRQLLDKDIAFRVSENSMCICAHRFEPYPSSRSTADTEFCRHRTAEFAEFIRQGECSCKAQGVSPRGSLCVLPAWSPGGHLVSVRLTHLAASLGEAWLMEFLLDQGCSVNPLTATYRITPLRLAARSSYVDVVRILLNRGDETLRARPSDNSKLLHDVLCHAMRYSSPLDGKDEKHCETFKLLVDSEIWDVNERDENGETVLISAVDSEVLDDVEALLNAHADPNAVSDDGFPPLFMALDHGNCGISSALIKAGADVNAVFDKTTVVQAAVDDGFFEIADLLLKSGADPNKVPEGAQPPIIMASISSDVERVELLIKFGADVNLPRKDGITALHCAATWVGSQKCLELLLMNGANPNSQSQCLTTPMHFAAYYGNVTSMATLLEFGADPDVLNCINASPIWYAVAMQHTDVVRALVGRNVTMDMCSYGNDPGMEHTISMKVYPDKKSILWVAVERNCPDIVQILLNAGYNIWREPWLVEGNDTDLFGEESLAIFHELQTSAKEAPSLLSLCRFFFKEKYRSNLDAIVHESHLPQTLKDFLL